MSRPIALLAAGAIAGLALAAANLVAPARDAGELPGDAVAAVNGTLLRRADYERAIAALAADRRDGLSEADERHVLDRLVDEELLVQRAFELGLARSDRRVRGDLVTAMIESITGEASLREPDAAELRAFYEANRNYFAAPGRLQVEQVFVRAASEADPAALARARAAAERLRAGAAAAAVQADAGDAPVAALPNAPLPLSKLREYLGPAAVQALLPLAPGEVAEPVRAAGGYHVLRVVAREPGATPALADVETEVRRELRRRAGDEALRSYVEELRRRAAIRVAGSAP